MASCFEIVDEEYISELVKNENGNTKSNEELRVEHFQKVREWKKFPIKFRRIREWFLRSNFRNSVILPFMLLTSIRNGFT